MTLHKGAEKGCSQRRPTSEEEKTDYNWITQPSGFKGTHDILWPSTPVASTSPSLITGLVLGEKERLVDNLMDWESKLESADLEGHKMFLEKAGLPICDSPLEATAWENGFVPEAQRIPVSLRCGHEATLASRLAARICEAKVFCRIHGSP